MIDLESDSARPLTGKGYDQGRYAWTSSFSSDGSRIAVAWYETEVDAHSLSIEAFDGSSSRLLIPASMGTYFVEPLDWTVDDRAVVVGLWTTGGDWAIGVAAVDDGAVRVVRTLGWEAPGGAHPQAYPRARVSPRGDVLAFDYPSEEAAPGADVFGLSLIDGSMWPIASGPGNDRFAAWAEDGDGVLV